MDANPQKRHYENIHDAYERHYYDDASLAYRRRFILDRLLGDDDLTGARIADLACGSGYNSLLLQERFSGLKVEGFDISASACAAYRENTGAPAHETDLTQPIPDHQPFDAAIIIGGLHHCVADLDQALNNLHRMLRPGGHLYIMEPNASFALDKMRSLWYRQDKYFDADTERALHREDLEQRAEGFSPVRSFYFGGPAYFFILNSLVTRTPLSIKKWIAPPLFACESGWHSVMPEQMMAAFGAAWVRQ